jgi:hypothetical protein
METKSELNNVVIEGNKLPEPPKKIKKTKPKMLIVEEDIVTEEPTNVEEEIEKIKAELEEEGKVGRPKDPVRYGKDDHPQGRDPLGIKTLKQKEDSVKYKSRNSYTEIFKDMEGKTIKRILTEEK